MVFSSTIFLWLFLPLVIIINFLAKRKYKNYILLLASLIFYAWGEPKYIIWMLISITANYFFGILIEHYKSDRIRKLILVISVVANLSYIGYFKYYNFFGDILNSILGKEVMTLKEIALPIGISFYTFQALSYVIDVYRSKKENGPLKAQRNILNVALYVSLFPQLIAGPIVKYYDIENEIYKREESVNRMAYGIKRFVYGLSKKVLISNVLAQVADGIFSGSVYDLGTTITWIGIISYTLQIYYDFSGYSDMAIGLGHMIGFTFLENFNYPYISKSISEFWKRWHISLSSWFREYLYIPLGGNRKGKKRTYINLGIVFFATGLWHGASINFIFWGLYHGFFMIVERLFLGNILKKNKFKLLNHIYTMFIVIIGWVFFRIEEFKDAIYILKIMFVKTEAINLYSLDRFVNTEVILTIILGILFSGIIQGLFPKFKSRLYNMDKIGFIEATVLGILLFLSIMTVASGTYNPFIYFRF